MACVHKFGKYLNLERLDFEPTTLIVGTFNPSWGTKNTARWFYGRTEKNYFWDVLPKLIEGKSLIDSSPKEWKLFCHRNKIAITDLIASIEDADQENPEHYQKITSFSDSEIANCFFEFNLVNVVRLIRINLTIKNIYVTRSFKETFWKHLLYPVKRYCNEFGIGLKPLVTPSGYAYFQQGKHNKVNPNDMLSLEDFILKRWREEWHQN